MTGPLLIAGILLIIGSLAPMTQGFGDLHVTVASTRCEGNLGFYLREQIEMVKAAVLYADRVSLVSSTLTAVADEVDLFARSSPPQALGVQGVLPADCCSSDVGAR